jgi:hypothetical protein
MHWAPTLIAPSTHARYHGRDTISADWQAGGKQGWYRHGVQAIDFKRAIDLTTYPPGTTFTGRGHANATASPGMLDGKPWVYEVCAGPFHDHRMGFS